MEKGHFFFGEIESPRSHLNKDIKKENFKKDLMNLIETNRHINMASDLSLSSNSLFNSFTF